MSVPLDAFIPAPDVLERHQVTVRAPADRVYGAAVQFDVRTLPLLRAVFGLRAVLLRSDVSSRWTSEGFLPDMQQLGWGVLLEKPPNLLVVGASCQPWLPDVEFRSHTRDDFAAFAEPNQVKIAWSLEIDSSHPSRSILASETRVAATDAEARRLFSRYWRWARFGIVFVRRLLLPAIRRDAERQFLSASHAP